MGVLRIDQEFSGAKGTHGLLMEPTTSGHQEFSLFQAVPLRRLYCGIIQARAPERFAR